MNSTVRYRFLRCLLPAALCAFSVGCTIPAPQAPQTPDLGRERPKTLIEAQKVVRPPGPPPFTEQLLPVTQGLADETRLYTLNLDNAPLGSALRSVLRNTDLSLSVDEEVDLGRKVTVHLKNSTLKETLDLLVVKGAGYAWQLEGGQLEINRFEERLYALDYLDLPGATNIDVGGDMLASSVEKSGVTGKYQVRSSRNAEDADVWVQAKEVLEGIKSEDGVLRINRGSGLIYLYDTPKKVAAMVRFLDNLRESLQRQVFIEARILEVQLEDSSRYGIDWSQINIAINPSSFGYTPDIVNFNFNRAGIITLNEVTGLEAVLDFLDQQGEVSVLSNPHISVMNGKSAVMTVGSQFPFSDITGVSRDEETNVVTIDATIKRVVFGLQLGITPQISADGVITLNVVPTITRQEGTEEIEIPIGGLGTQTFDNPVIGLQELATTVRVREGQAVVLAGLISQEKELDGSGLPGLRKIPLLGRLFSNAQKEVRSRELVILIKPYLKEVG